MMPAFGASLIHDTETERAIGKLVLPLAQAANIPESRMKIHIINDEDFNAFVMGGEDIYVSERNLNGAVHGDIVVVKLEQVMFIRVC